MKTCPEYRVRLFLTVDLVGSTAYKAKSSEGKENNKEPHPEWVNRFRKFYQQFPQILDSSYKETETGKKSGAELPPQVWKTIGDEILFCCRVLSVQHLACCVSSFLRALETYGSTLDSDGIPLDVKGSGWVAAFPAENISIEVFNGSVSATVSNEDYVTEHFESAADSEPHKFDFLGTGIDTGFRIAKNAASDRFTASIGLAYLLSKAAQENQFAGRFTYHGRERFKGVNRDQPYPVVSIEAERDPVKRRLRARERLLTREVEAAPVSLHDYLQEFMHHQSIDAPCLPNRLGDECPPPPKSYAEFQAAWEVNVKETDERDESARAAESASVDEDQPLSDDVISFAEDAVSKEFAASSELIGPRRKRRRRNSTGGRAKGEK